MTRVQELLAEIFHPAGWAIWLNKPQAHFGGRTAQQVIDAGEHEEVENLLEALADGTVL